MRSTPERRILVVANRTAATPEVLAAVRRYAREQLTAFTLIPDAPRSKHTDWTLERALPLLERAAGGRVEGLAGTSADPFDAIQNAVAKWSLRPDRGLDARSACIAVASPGPADTSPVARPPG